MTLKPFPVVPDPIRSAEHYAAPVWPTNVIGSITHCDGYRAAAVSLSHHYAAVGIDAEPVGTLPEAVVRRAFSQQEISMSEELKVTNPSIAWDTIIFSAKESVYKATSSYAGEWLDLRDIMISLNQKGRYFSVHSWTPLLSSLQTSGQWAVGRPKGGKKMTVVTAAVIH
jgi:4'-phosphopantetheinyl transferase EntD